MGRKKKNDSGKLAALAREYYEKEAFGNPKKLKCSNFAKYAREHGCNAQAYDFRRDREVRAFMDEVLGGHEDADEYPLQAVYRNLDLSKPFFFRKSSDIIACQQRMIHTVQMCCDHNSLSGFIANHFHIRQIHDKSSCVYSCFTAIQNDHIRMIPFDRFSYAFIINCITCYI